MGRKVLDLFPNTMRGREKEVDTSGLKDHEKTKDPFILKQRKEKGGTDAFKRGSVSGKDPKGGKKIN